MKKTLITLFVIFGFLTSSAQTEKKTKSQLFNEISQLISQSESNSFEPFELVSKNPNKLKLEIKHKGHHGITGVLFYDHYYLDLNYLNGINKSKDGYDIDLNFNKKFVVKRIVDNKTKQKVKEKQFSFSNYNKETTDKLEKLIQSLIEL